MPKINLPPSENFFSSLVVRADCEELDKMRAELRRILAQPDEHDPRLMLARLKEAASKHAVAPTQENYSALNAIAMERDSDPRLNAELTNKWDLMKTASKRQAWSYFASTVRPKLIAVLERKALACEKESEVQERRESEWGAEFAPFIAWANYFGASFSTNTRAPLILRERAAAYRAGIASLQECRMVGTTLPQETQDFLAGR
jgi:hypothetical protein